MDWRNSVAGAILLVSATFAAAGAAADEEGCAALAERVKAGVFAVARDHRVDLADAQSGGTTRLAPAVGGRYTCSATAAVASRAFGDALRGLALRLRWDGDWIRPGDYCLSHRLDQCYPSQDRFAALPSPADFAFATRAWRGVRRALTSQMPYGPDGDLSSFTADSLDSALSSELSATFGPAIRGEAQSRAVRDRRSRPR